MRAMLIPVEGEVRTIDLELGDWAPLIGAEVLDFITVIRHHYQVAVDDTGVLDGKPVNRRVQNMLEDHGKHLPLGVRGDVLVVGVDELGDWIDLSEDFPNFPITGPRI